MMLLVAVPWVGAAGEVVASAGVGLVVAQPVFHSSGAA